jgi:hypothetical protein
MYVVASTLCIVTMTMEIAVLARDCFQFIHSNLNSLLILLLYMVDLKVSSPTEMEEIKVLNLLKSKRIHLETKKYSFRF